MVCCVCVGGGINCGVLCVCVGGWCMWVNVYVLLCITTLYIQPYIQADLYTGSVLMHMSVSHHN